MKILVVTLLFSNIALAKDIRVFYKEKRNLKSQAISPESYKEFINYSVKKGLPEKGQQLLADDEKMYLRYFVLGLSTDVRAGLGPINTSISNGLEFHYRVLEGNE